MPAFLLHAGATVQCSHGGSAQPLTANERVMVGGQPTVTIAGVWSVAGCSLPPQANGPCVTATFLIAATRLTANGQAVVLANSQAECEPNGTPLVVAATQTRVSGE